MAGPVGLDTIEVIRQIKGALWLGNALGDDDLPLLTISQVELTLKAVVSQAAGAELRFQVPFIGQDGGARANVSLEQATTFAYRFVPVAPTTEHEVAIRPRSLRHDLAMGILEIRRVVAAAATSSAKPGEQLALRLQEGTLTLDFIVDLEGKVSLLDVLSAEAARRWANTIVLTIGA